MNSSFHNQTIGRQSIVNTPSEHTDNLFTPTPQSMKGGPHGSSSFPFKNIEGHADISIK